MRGPCFYRGKEEIGEGCRGSSLAADGGQLVLAGSIKQNKYIWYCNQNNLKGLLALVTPCFEKNRVSVSNVFPSNHKRKISELVSTNIIKGIKNTDIHNAFFSKLKINYKIRDK